jgi:hypothetical protein
MIFREALFTHIKTIGALSYPFIYGFASPDDVPAYTMQMVSDSEDKAFICLGNNDSGEALIQFQFAAPASGTVAWSPASGTVAWTQGSVESQLEELKNVVKNIVGQVSYGGSTYRLYNNRTTGIQASGDPDGLYYGSRFEAQVNWVKE